MAKTLGILGGLGPMAGVYFYQLVTDLTAASCDQEHLRVVLTGFSDTPDRTAHILDKTAPDPTPQMISAAQTLEKMGAEIIAMPCNTAHYFYDAVAGSIRVPMLNIIEETLRLLQSAGAKKIGILATEGTILAKTYPMRAEKFGIVCEEPTPAEQAVISEIIYGQIKQGKTPDIARFEKVANSLFARGCTHLVLGCTELSLLNQTYHLDARYVDSLYALARATVLACGAPLRTDR